MKNAIKRLAAAALALCMMLSMMISASAVVKYYVKFEIYDTKYDVTVSEESGSVVPARASLADTVNTLIGKMYDEMNEKFDTTWMGTTLKYGVDAYLDSVGEGGNEATWSEWVDKTYTDEVDDTDAGKLKELIRDLDTTVDALYDENGNVGKEYKMAYTPDIHENYASDKAYGNTYVFTVSLISKNVTVGGGAPATPSTPSYRVGVSAVENASVKVSETDVKVGDKVTVTVIPDAGYKAESVVVKTGAGAEVAVTDNGDGTYSFTMPEGAVTIAVAVTEGTVDPAAGFQDLVADAWYMAAVRYCLTNDIMAGYNETTFGPIDNLSRAMVVQVLYNYEKNPEAFTTVNFDDVADGQWYSDAIRWASSKGVVAGYGDGTFGTEDNVTIEQVAVILWNYSGTPAAEAADLSALGTSSSWAANALNWAVANGIFKDMPMENANATASRAQTAQMLMNYLSK